MCLWRNQYCQPQNMSWANTHFSHPILMLLVSYFTFLPTQFQNSNNISKNERKQILPHFNLSLAMPCVCQGEIHAYLRYPSGLFDTSLYNFLHLPSSFPLFYLSEGWEQQGTSDRLIRAERRMTMLITSETRWSHVSVCGCLYVAPFVIVCMQASICQCRCLLVSACVFVPLLSAEPPWDEGEEEDDELEEVLCSMASRESSDRRRSGLLK